MAIKLQDSLSFNIDPADILSPEMRKEFKSIHFEASNFRSICIMETIGLIFIASKVIDGARLNKKFNTIILTLG
jgi:hypothetical protein